MGSFIKELWMFVRTRKKLRTLPLIVVTLLFGLLMLFAQGSAVAPFIYTFF